MSDEIVGCVCGFKCCKSTLYKTAGKCPKCGKLLSVTVANEMNSKNLTQ